MIDGGADADSGKRQQQKRGGRFAAARAADVAGAPTVAARLTG